MKILFKEILGSITAFIRGTGEFSGHDRCVTRARDVTKAVVPADVRVVQLRRL